MVKACSCSFFRGKKSDKVRRETINYNVWVLRNQFAEQKEESSHYKRKKGMKSERYTTLLDFYFKNILCTNKKFSWKSSQNFFHEYILRMKCTFCKRRNLMMTNEMMNRTQEVFSQVWRWVHWTDQDAFFSIWLSLLRQVKTSQQDKKRH